MTDIEYTLQWIERHHLKDASGRPHFPHGIWTSRAWLHVYVMFDNDPLIGRRAIYFLTERLKQFARDLSNMEPVRGSTAKSSIADTGAGYLFAPIDVGWDRREMLEPHDDGGAVEAVLIVKRQLEQRQDMGDVRHASMSEQHDGIDLIANDPRKRYGMDTLPVEVKSRPSNRCYQQLFLQISETNPDRIY